MAEQAPRKRKVVKSTSETTPQSTENGRVWTPSAESKSKATTNRVIAFILWGVAIAGEIAAIFWLIPLAAQNLYFYILIGVLVVIAVLAIVANLMWRKANELDPASEKNKVAFFIQNQLGVIMTIVAFLPLIIIIFTNKNMDNTQKGIAGGIGIVLMLVAGYFGVELNAKSQEMYSSETALVVYYTGEDKVFWVGGGSVYHLCAEVSDLNQGNSADPIVEGTVQQAVSEGKSRLTKKVQAELNQCGIEKTALAEGEEIPGTDGLVVFSPTKDEE